MLDKKKICFWSILLIILIVLTVVFSARTVHKYEVWNDHEDYLKSNDNYVTDWMHINLISKRSGIPKESIYDIIGIEESFTNSRKPLNELCKGNNLNCTKVVQELNTLVESGKPNTNQGKRP